MFGWSLYMADNRAKLVKNKLQVSQMLMHLSCTERMGTFFSTKKQTKKHIVAKIIGVASAAPTPTALLTRTTFGTTYWFWARINRTSPPNV